MTDISCIVYVHVSDVTFQLMTLLRVRVKYSQRDINFQTNNPDNRIIIKNVYFVRGIREILL